MADIGDMAQELDDLHRDHALKNHQRLLPHTPGNFDGSSCVDCGEYVGSGRLALGCFRCIDCQVAHESAHRLYR